MRISEAITSEDRHYVKRYMIISLVIAAFDRDSRFIQQQLKTPGPYVDIIKLATENAWADLRDVKKHFWLKGMKVYEEKRTPLGIMAKFKCRGYVSSLELRWEYISAEASVLMRKYLGLDVSQYVNKSVSEEIQDKY
ncbi:hypothetical protein PAEVO_03970 [Paenibacillus sp. GM2FR]|uniref:hypothetical protein n=1 Tax=Paenibacillus sp. GM2FR TaxID=2059268 RepID=UPI000C27D22D|nr:hypothetical protein [Paenibacillus sp. GM2FR]PJN53676.1 hypothetical protein PAEVO_03970 [Paenibacillus sp. GM2FR]